jgi:quercetin dioxygenase-like cupin family protein
LILSLVTGFLGAVVSGQEPAVLPLDAEPHHHLALKNEYVKVYQVEVAPHDAVKLHRHDTDAISLSLSESLVTVHFPGKPDAQQKLTNGQIRLQARGYVHSTSVDGDTPFRNVTVELLMPQTGARNGCAQVIAGQAVHCVVHAGEAPVPQFETEQTSVGLVRLQPQQHVVIGKPGRAILIVSLDGGASYKNENGVRKSLQAGDFVWLDKGKQAEAFRNESAREVRLVCFDLAPTDGAAKTGS